MNKLDQNTKNSLNFLWFIILITCLVITYYCMKVRATNTYKEILQVAAENCNSEVVKFLVKDIVNISNNPSFGSIALLHAARGGCLNIIEFLIVEKKVNVNAVDKYAFKRTALHHAADQGHLEVVRFLLEKDANPNIRGNDGRNPRDIAVARSRYNQDKSYNEIISLLYEAEKQYKSE